MNSFFLSFSVLLLFTACQQIDLGDYTNTSSNDDTYEVNITSKSGESGVELPYPLTVYAVNEEGLVEDRASITQSGTSVNLSLLSGDFTFYAIAGADAGNNNVPANNIITAENGYFTNAVMRGKKSQTIEDNEELSLTLSYAVASVDVTLSNIPADVKAISVKIATLRETMNLDGEYDGSTTATIDLEKQTDGTTWKSATVYVFPSVSAPTTFTVTQTLNDNTTKSYSASYNAKLSAGTPYHFTGTGTTISNHELVVNIEVGGWDSSIDQELTLTPIESGDGGGTIDSDGETYYVNSIPTEAGTVLDGKYVLAYVDGNQGLLYSKADIISLIYKNTTEGKENYNKIMNSVGEKIAEYSENGFTGWSIPTIEQYNNIKSQATANKIASAIKTLTSKSFNINSDHYYFCDNNTKAFSWNNFSGDGSVGLNVSGKNYHLRLVKPITFKLKSE